MFKKNLSQKTNIFIIFLVLSYSCVFYSAADARETTTLKPVQITQKSKEISLNKNLAYLRDADQKYTASDLLKAEHTKEFTVSDQHSLNFGFSKEPVWVKFIINNSSHKVINFLLEVPSPLIDTVDLYIPDNARIQYTKIQAGETIPLSKRPAPTISPVFNVQQAPNTSTTYLLKYQDNGSVPFSMTLWNPLNFSKHNIVVFVYILS